MKIIAVASGKGGVGKSTVAANLAVTPVSYTIDGKPLNVSLVDVDFYGPSIPTLMGGGELQATPEGKFIPAKRHGVKFISIAFFLKNPDDPVVWRGPMFGKAMNQLFSDVSWGDTDICIVDMPPGTGDAQLSLAQLVQLDGAVMVTTPQEVALTDVRRAVNMFRKVEVPLLGVIENMSGYKLPSGEIDYLFGEGGGETLAKNYDLPFLGPVPIDKGIRVGGDTGLPIALDKAGREIFEPLAQALYQQLEAGSNQQQLKVVN